MDHEVLLKEKVFSKAKIKEDLRGWYSVSK